MAKINAPVSTVTGFRLNPYLIYQHYQKSATSITKAVRQDTEGSRSLLLPRTDLTSQRLVHLFRFSRNRCPAELFDRPLPAGQTEFRL
jgi:hypothetical protein